MMKRGSSSREKALKNIYLGNKDKVFHLVLTNNGTEDEAKDIYQEAVIAFFENVRDNKFEASSAIGTYLYSIAKFKWMNKLKRKNVMEKHATFLKDSKQNESNQLDQIVEKEKRQMVLQLFENLGGRCKEILIESIYYNSSMKEIATKGNFSNEQIVRNQKSKCLKKLRDLIKENPSIVNLIKQYD